MDRDPLTATDEVLAGYEQANKSTSQEPETNSTRENEEVNKSTSQESGKLTIEEVNNSESHQADSVLVTSQEPNMLKSQQVSKSETRKSTFQLDVSVLEALDTYHLQLQIAMGKRNAPYKEIIVEEAIAQWLERATKSPDRTVKNLLKRQEQRQQ